MELLQATDQNGGIHYGAIFRLPGGTVHVPLNQSNTPASLSKLYKRYLSGEISVKGCMSFCDLIPKSLR